MQKELVECKSIQGVEHFAAQGAEQFTRIREKFENLREILAQKLNTGELTYGRYFGTAEQVYLSVLDNLRDVVNLLNSVSSIDADYINSRLYELSKHKNPTEADKQEVETLNERKQLRESQSQKVDVLLTLNEKAMTQIDQTTAAIAEMKTVMAKITDTGF